MTYDKAKIMSKILKWVCSMLLFVVILSSLDTVTYGCPIVLVWCILDIVLWFVASKKNKGAEEEKENIKIEFNKSIYSLVACAVIIAVAAIIKWIG